MGIKIFKEVLAYRMTQDVDLFQRGEDDELNLALKSRLSRQPASNELGTFGFVEPVGEEDQFFERLSDGSILITAQQWKRDLPASVVNREVAARVRNIEKEENRKVYAKEKRQIKDDVVLAFLPRAFVKGKRVSALIKDPYIFIDTGSAKLAEALLSTIRECLGSLPIRPVTVKHSPVVSMTSFLRHSEVDESFVLGESFQAKGASDEASTLSGKSVNLSEDDIRELLASGRQVTQLEMGFLDEDNGETVYFTLTEDLVVKGIQWPDVLQDQASADAGEEADMVTTYRATLLLISDALGRLYSTLMDTLGGEDIGQQALDAFEKRMEKAIKDVAKNMKSFKLGDTNLATDSKAHPLEHLLDNNVDGENAEAKAALARIKGLSEPERDTNLEELELAEAREWEAEEDERRALQELYAGGANDLDDLI